jgi:thioredoxin 2
MDPITIACPTCHTLVRVPAKRLTEEPKCARCKSSILSGKPLALDGQTFDKHATRAAFPLLVDFWAPWCGPCRMMAPILDRLAAEWPTRLHVGKVNSDDQPALSARFGIRGIPTVILFRNGAEIARQTGAMDYGTLTRWLEGAIGKQAAA